MGDGFGREVRRLLKENGCRFARQGKGDHEIWYSPITEKYISVDMKIMARRWALSVLKEAGIRNHGL